MAAEAAPEVYHERQRFALCGLHSLNAMMQHDWQRFTGEEMEVIADTLFARERELGIAGFAATHCPGWLARRFFNPHKAGFGTGNYDMDTMMEAIGTRDLEGRWFDARSDVGEIALRRIVGVLVNQQTHSWGIGSGRHWFTVRRVGRVFYDLNSNHKEPFPFRSAAEVLDFLRTQLAEDAHLILVYRRGTNPLRVPGEPEEDEAGEGGDGGGERGDGGGGGGGEGGGGGGGGGEGGSAVGRSVGSAAEAAAGAGAGVGVAVHASSQAPPSSAVEVDSALAASMAVMARVNDEVGSV